MTRKALIVVVIAVVGAIAGLAAWIKYGWRTEMAYIQVTEVRPAGISSVWISVVALALVVGAILWLMRRRHV
jgi:hypothetical protein